MKEFNCVNCGNKLFYKTNYCVYCGYSTKSNYLDESIKGKTIDKINNLICNYTDEEKEKIFIDNMVCKEGRTSTKYGFAHIESYATKEEIDNTVYLTCKKKKISLILNIFLLPIIISIGIIAILAFAISFDLFFVEAIPTALLLIWIFISNMNLTKKYSNELNHIRFYNAIKGIKYSSYKLKYSNEETGTISFEDSDGNRHSISAFIGFNSKFR